MGLRGVHLTSFPLDRLFGPLATHIWPLGYYHRGRRLAGLMVATEREPARSLLAPSDPKARAGWKALIGGWRPFFTQRRPIRLLFMVGKTIGHTPLLWLPTLTGRPEENFPINIQSHFEIMEGRTGICADDVSFSFFSLSESPGPRFSIHRGTLSCGYHYH